MRTHVLTYLIINVYMSVVACAVAPGGGGGGGVGGGRQNRRVPPQPINSHHATVPQVGFLMRKLDICAKYTIAYIQFFAQ